MLPVARPLAVMARFPPRTCHGLQGTDKALLKYKGPINTASTIIKEEGLRALWSGNTATVIRQASGGAGGPGNGGKGGGVCWFVGPREGRWEAGSCGSQI